MLKPAYKVTLGSSVMDSAADPTRSTVVSLQVSVDLDTPADEAVIGLGRVDGPHPEIGDDVIVELGYAGDSTTRVFTGAAAHVSPDFTATRVNALSPFLDLLTLRVEETFLSKSAGQIARDLAGRAGLTVESVEDGERFPAYVADGRRNAYQHIRALADKSGFDVYASADGAFVFRKFAGNITTHLFEYGKQILEMSVKEAPEAFGEVQAYGESPADSEGDQAFAWLTKSFNPGLSGSGEPRLLLEDSSLRTRAAAAAAARAAARRLQQRRLTGRLRALGRPAVKLGHAVRVSGAPDDRMNDTFQVRRVRHRLDKNSGFTTEIHFWSMGGGNS